MAREGSSLRDLIAELKRRRVFRVAAAYAALGFVLVQAAAYVFEALLFPEWAHRMLVVFLLFGFPVALLLAWAFEITPEGVRPTTGWGEGTESDGSRGAEGEAATATPVPAARLATVLGLVVAVTLMVAGAGWLVWTAWLAPASPDRPPRATAAESAADLDPRRVAVLPFDDHSEGQELGHIAKGLTEALIHELNKSEPLDVISRNGIKPFERPGVALDSVARVLGVGSVVEGSVEADGGALVVTVQLIDGATASHVSSQRVRGRLDTPLDLRNELVRQVALLLRRHLGEEVRLREARESTESSEAWELYQLALQFREDGGAAWADAEHEMARRLLRKADSLFAESEARDPGWIRPVIERGFVALMQARVGNPNVANATRVHLEEGLDHAERALSMAPDAPAALELRGQVRYFMARSSRAEGGRDLLDAAEEDLREAVTREPGRARAWARLAYVLWRQGRFPEAQWAVRHAEEADAYLWRSDKDYLYLFSQLALDREDLASADTLTKEGLKAYPGEPAFLEQRLLYLASTGSSREDVREAWSTLEAMEDALSVRRWELGRLLVAAVLARAGLGDSARSVMNRAEMDSPEYPHNWSYGAYVSLQLGDTARSLDLLARFAEAVPGDRGYLAKDWWWRPLRDDPRFVELVADVEADTAAGE